MQLKVSFSLGCNHNTMRVFCLTQVGSSGKEKRIGLKNCLRFNFFSKVSFVECWEGPGEAQSIFQKIRELSVLQGGRRHGCVLTCLMRSKSVPSLILFLPSWLAAVALPGSGVPALHSSWLCGSLTFFLYVLLRWWQVSAPVFGPRHSCSFPTQPPLLLFLPSSLAHQSVHMLPKTDRHDHAKGSGSELEHSFRKS